MRLHTLSFAALLCCGSLLQAADGLPLREKIVAEKAAASSPMTLQAIFDRGKAFWTPRAEKAVKRLKEDAAFAQKLKAEAGKTGGAISTLDLRRVVAMESQADRNVGRRPDTQYVGPMQMGEVAVKDVRDRAAGFKRLTIDDIDDPAEWERNVEAGRAYLVLNGKSFEYYLKQQGIPAEEAASLAAEPVLRYFAHQQGAKGAARLIAGLRDGDRETLADGNMLSNLKPNSAFYRDLNTGGHKPRVIEYYAYMLGAYAAIQENVD